MDVAAIDKLRASARDSVRKLSRICEDDDIVEAKKLVEELRKVAAYDEMGQLAEAVSRSDPKDAKNRRLYAQYLINTGKATAAIDPHHAIGILRRGRLGGRRRSGARV